LSEAPEHELTLPDRDYGGYIFDCDGTLADSMPLHFKAWRKALSVHHAPFEFTWELFVRRAGKILEDTVDELNVEFQSKLDPSSVTRVQRETYNALLPKVGPVRPVVDFVRSIAGRRPVAVASGSDRPTVLTTLEAIGIRDLFSVIVTAESVVHGKPAPDMFLLAAERLGVPPEQCVVFEDGILGIEAAKRAKMAWVFVERLSPPEV